MESTPRDSSETRRYEVITTPDDEWGEAALRSAGASDDEVDTVRAQLSERFGDPPPHGTRQTFEFQYLVRYERLAGPAQSEDDERMWDPAFLATLFERVGRLESTPLESLVQSPFVAAEVPTVAVYPAEDVGSESIATERTVITMLGPIKGLGSWHDFWEWIAPSYDDYLAADDALDPDEPDAKNPLEDRLRAEAEQIEREGREGTVVLDGEQVPAMIYEGASLVLTTVERVGMSVLAYSTREGEPLCLDVSADIPLASSLYEAED